MFNSMREYVLVAIMMTVLIVCAIDAAVDGLGTYLATVIAGI